MLKWFLFLFAAAQAARKYAERRALIDRLFAAAQAARKDEQCSGTAFEMFAAAQAARKSNQVPMRRTSSVRRRAGG